jgi:NADH-quinone oxidoreductase E subunit
MGVFGDKVMAKVGEILRRYPYSARSAMLPLLWLAQREHGYVSLEAMEEIARIVGVTPVEVYDTASFYHMLRLEPAGKHEIHVCTNLACMLRGGLEVLEALEQRLGVKVGQTTPDGLVTLKEAECLACCDRAVVVQVDEEFVTDVTPEQLDRVLERLR